MEHSAFQQVVGDLVMQRQNHCYPPSSLVRRSTRPPHASTVVDKAASAWSLAALPLRHHCLLWAICTTVGFIERRVEIGAVHAATRPMEKMPHTQPVLRSMVAREFAGAGLKIVTNIAGMLGPVVLIDEKGGQQRSAWDLVQLRARLGQ
jgi:hypothetical protein